MNKQNIDFELAKINSENTKINYEYAKINSD